MDADKMELRRPPDAIGSLRDSKIWLLWALEQATGKARKVPWYASGGRRRGVQGSDEDRARLVTFDEALRAFDPKRHAGLGIALLKGQDLVALDFDNCVEVDGSIHPEVLGKVQATYAERSPSGRGIRALFRGDLGDRKTFDGAFGFEVFSTTGFVTLTFDALPSVADLDLIGDIDAQIARVPPALVAYCEQRFGSAKPAAEFTDADWFSNQSPPLGYTHEQIADCLDVLDPNMRREPWLRIGMGIHHETAGSDEGFELWRAWSEAGATFNLEHLQRDWESFSTDRGRKVVTMRSLVKLANAAGARISEAPPVDADGFDAAADVPNPPISGGLILHCADEFAQRAPLAWIIKDILPQASVGVLYGEPGAGKSFLALDMLAAIAWCDTWRGRKIKSRGRVVIVAAEGAGGMVNRVRAYMRHHEVTLHDNLRIVDAPINLSQGKDVGELARAVKAVGGATVIAIDTLAAATPGMNENVSEDVGAVLDYCAKLSRATGALVLLIAHSGKDSSRGVRGWSGIKGAVDVQIEVTRSPTGRKVRFEKIKDAGDGIELGFALRVVTLGLDEDGDPITSCVCVDADVPERLPPTLKGQNQRLARQNIDLALIAAKAGDPMPLDAVIDEMVGSMKPPKGDARDRRREYAREAIDALLTRGDADFLISGDGDIVPRPTV